MACASRDFLHVLSGIGRRTRLRIWRKNPWGFESPLSHHLTALFILPFTCVHAPKQSLRVRIHTVRTVFCLRFVPDCACSFFHVSLQHRSGTFCVRNQPIDGKVKELLERLAVAEEAESIALAAELRAAVRDHMEALRNRASTVLRRLDQSDSAD